MVMHRLATGATAALAFLLSAVADAGDEAPKGGDGDRSFVMDNAGKFIEEAAAAPKKAKWKKKHLLLMAWGGVFLVLWSVAGFFLYRYMNSGKRAASTRDKDTRQKKKEEKAQKQKQKEEDEAPPPAPIEPTIARNVKRKELEEKARVALEAAPKFEGEGNLLLLEADPKFERSISAAGSDFHGPGAYAQSAGFAGSDRLGMASVEAVRVGPSADQFETRVTRFERELDLLSPVALKELSPGAHSGKPWWGNPTP
ncbi:hypothetical protein T484DRAFT_1788584 [Baffinella frigidus]|nr:hypothetical protein T484DRAFT_1788584 [Cryptophyta sp. CCMP2293]